MQVAPIVTGGNLIIKDKTMDELPIIAQIRKYLDEVTHAIADGDKQTAVDRLTDTLAAVEALQSVTKLPAACVTGLAEIWT
jgi:hypothetical protein